MRRRLEDEIAAECQALYATITTKGARGPIHAKAVRHLRRLTRLFAEQAKERPELRDGLTTLAATVATLVSTKKPRTRGKGFDA